MRSWMFSILSVCVLLSACDHKPEDDQTVLIDAPTPSLKISDPSAFHASVQSAMTEITPALRVRFQEHFVCAMRENNKREVPKPVTADYIRRLAKYLAAHPEAQPPCSPHA